MNPELHMHNVKMAAAAACITEATGATSIVLSSMMAMMEMRQMQRQRKCRRIREATTNYRYRVPLPVPHQALEFNLNKMSDNECVEFLRYYHTGIFTNCE